MPRADAAAQVCFRIGGVDRRAREEVQGGRRDARAEPADGLQRSKAPVSSGRRRASSAKMSAGGGRARDGGGCHRRLGFTRRDGGAQQMGGSSLPAPRGARSRRRAGLPAQIGSGDAAHQGSICCRSRSCWKACASDAIAQGTYPVDIHNPRGRGIVFKHLDGRRREVLPDGSRREETWTPDGKERQTPCYQVPYGVLVPRKVENLLVAGRCISATHEAHGAIRVRVNCMQFGQAAGAAAALCVREVCSRVPARCCVGPARAGCCFLGEYRSWGC